MNLREQINNIKIIDQHIHALDYLQWMRGTGKYPWPEALAHLPVPTPLTTLPQAKAMFTVYREVYGFPYSTLTPENIKKLDELYLKAQDDEASLWDKVLKLANIESVVEVNQDNLELPPKLDPQRYKLAPMVDGLLVPLDNTEMKKSFSPLVVTFFTMYEAFLKNVRGQQKINSFKDYLNFISSVLQKTREQGGVCLKMNYAYWRDIAIEVVSKEEARDIFESKDTRPVRYKRLQDYILWYIISKSADYDLPVQVHTGGTSVPHSMEEINPARLDSFLMLPEIKKAKVVLLHGGYPFCREAGFMVSRSNAPNLYLDISAIWWEHYSSPRGLVGTLREWLEMGIAEKLLYGSDSATPLRFLIGAINIREGLYLALKGMIDDGMIDENQALSIARMVLRENAKKLYKM